MSAETVREFADLVSDFEDAVQACVPQSSLDYPTAEQREERDRLRGGVVGTYHALLAEVERLRAALPETMIADLVASEIGDVLAADHNGQQITREDIRRRAAAIAGYLTHRLNEKGAA